MSKIEKAIRRGAGLNRYDAARLFGDFCEPRLSEIFTRAKQTGLLPVRDGSIFKFKRGKYDIDYEGLYRIIAPIPIAVDAQLPDEIQPYWDLEPYGLDTDLDLILLSPDPTDVTRAYDRIRFSEPHCTIYGVRQMVPQMMWDRYQQDPDKAVLFPRSVIMSEYISTYGIKHPDDLIARIPAVVNQYNERAIASWVQPPANV